MQLVIADNRVRVIQRPKLHISLLLLLHLLSSALSDGEKVAVTLVEDGHDTTET